MNTEIRLLASTFAVVGRSAWATLEDLDRQARQDVAKIQRWLESDEVGQARRRAINAAQWGAAIALALGAVAFVLGQEARAWADRFVESSLEPTPDVEAVVEVAIAALPVGQLAGSLPLAEVVQWARPEVEAMELAMKAIAEAVAEMPPHRPGGGRRAYQERLFADAWALHGRARVSDAAALTVAQVAVNALESELEEAALARVAGG